MYNDSLYTYNSKLSHCFNIHNSSYEFKKHTIIVHVLVYIILKKVFGMPGTAYTNGRAASSDSLKQQFIHYTGHTLGFPQYYIVLFQLITRLQKSLHLEYDLTLRRSTKVYRWGTECLEELFMLFQVPQLLVIGYGLHGYLCPTLMANWMKV